MLVDGINILDFRRRSTTVLVGSFQYRGLLMIYPYQSNKRAIMLIDGINILEEGPRLFW